ncbi:D-TA family PLP-dependent enzyme [Negadavirga shengliensis]|uniref:D-TA family PLP-dependent enzyme n=1 Tax=Negadavirga shengliensis TaxID=1389218 RepID=A0ABV9T1A3_9BACT
MSAKWYETEHAAQIDSPALLIYPDRAKDNIDKALKMAGGPERLRPHVKTNKAVQACQMMMEAGITRFKCATIAEAEMLVMAGAKDILLAYQPVGPKIERLAKLIQSQPAVKFRCLIDHIDAAKQISRKMAENDLMIQVYIDLNAGTNRTGISPGAPAEQLYHQAGKLRGISVAGFHLYDGHLRNPDINLRRQECDEGFRPIASMWAKLEEEENTSLEMIAGGTTTFPIHAQRNRVTCSPGTFIYWDKGYGDVLPEQPFLPAALVMSRVISLPTPGLICLDLGHKSIASENPIEKRVTFLNAPDLKPVSQSEEHLVMDAGEGHDFKIGDVLYGVPYHVCPTVALHDRATVIKGGKIAEEWRIISRDRKINF